MSVLVHVGGATTPADALLREQVELAASPDDGACVLWASGDDAADALRRALDKPESVEALVLESPIIDAALEGRLGEIEARTLVLFGTGDENSQRGGIYKQRMRACNFILVYGAGREIARDRPEAFANLVSDFLARGERFVVSARPSVISP